MKISVKLTENCITFLIKKVAEYFLVIQYNFSVKIGISTKAFYENIAI